MKKAIQTIKSNPIDFIGAVILAGLVIGILVCFFVLGNGNYIAHF